MERQYLIHYNTSNNVVPTAEHMMYGEIAVRYSAGNEAIFIKNTNDEIITLNFNSSVDLFSVVSELPTNDNVSNNKIYLVPSENTGNTNTYIEYVNVNGEWEKLGEISVKTDLTEYYTKEEINELFSQTVQNLETLVSENQTEINSIKEDLETLDITVSTSLTELREELTETINLKADKNEIPSLSGYVTENYVNASLSNYALKSEIPSLEGYLTSIPEEYITETELNDKGYLTEHQNISHLVTKEELNGKADLIHTHDDLYYTESEINDMLSRKSDSGHTHAQYLTEHQDIRHLATKEELNGKADLIHAHNDLYYTESEINTMLSGKSDVNHTHAQYLTEHQDISGKQDVISDLENIRNGATLGAKALQEVPAEYVTETELNDKNYATKTDLSTLDSKMISGFNTINSQLSNYALKTELPTNTVTVPNDNEGITISRIIDNNNWNGVRAYFPSEYDVTGEGSTEAGSASVVLLDKYGKSGEIWVIKNYNDDPRERDIFAYVFDSGVYGEESSHNLYILPSLIEKENLQSQQSNTVFTNYLYDSTVYKNLEDNKYYTFNNSRTITETSKPTKTITIQEAINEIYKKLGLL